MDNKINLIIDFDSTFIKLETIEVLADFALKNKKDKKNILELIKKMTNKAMQGEIPFSDALNERINLINLKSKHIDLTINYLMNHITTSFIKNKKFFELNHKNCFIISGGFKEIIIPIVKNFNIPSNQVYANSFIYENNKLSLDKNNPLSKLGDINFWIDSKAYNFVENTHQLWLLTIVDLIIGKKEYLPN